MRPGRRLLRCDSARIRAEAHPNLPVLFDQRHDHRMGPGGLGDPGADRAGGIGQGGECDDLRPEFIQPLRLCAPVLLGFKQLGVVHRAADLLADCFQQIEIVHRK